jgi:hypothetical protein
VCRLVSAARDSASCVILINDVGSDLLESLRLTGVGALVWMTRTCREENISQQWTVCTGHGAEPVSTIVGELRKAVEQMLLGEGADHSDASHDFLIDALESRRFLPSERLLSQWQEGRKKLCPSSKSWDRCLERYGRLSCTDMVCWEGEGNRNSSSSLPRRILSRVLALLQPGMSNDR